MADAANGIARTKQSSSSARKGTHQRTDVPSDRTRIFSTDLSERLDKGLTRLNTRIDLLGRDIRRRLTYGADKMSRRAILRGQIKQAWQQCIDREYPNRLLNGERALQACLYQHLTRQFENNCTADSRRIFIEPSIRLEGQTLRRMPDMVVCDTKNVIAIIELKFHPRATLSGNRSGVLRRGSEKDVNTLVSVARDLNAVVKAKGKDTSHITIENRRYLGPKGATKSYRPCKKCAARMGRYLQESKR
jgi:hypothetical protein